MIDQQERTEVGASGDDLGAPFSLPGSLLRAHLLTTSKLAVVWPAAIVRPPGERGRDGSTISFPLPVYTADANGGLCIGRSRADHRGLGGL